VVGNPALTRVIAGSTPAPGAHVSRPRSSVAEHGPGTTEVTRSDSGRGLHADVAQLVAHHLAKVGVASSNLAICSKPI
jgi:hypothetical protein